MATYKQVDIVTESKQRGGKRENSGAKLKHGEPTKTIRLPISLVDKINQGLIDIATLSKTKETVTESNDKIKALEGKSELLAIDVENLTRDINSMNARNALLSNELKEAKAKQAHKGHDAKYWCDNYERQLREFNDVSQRLKELENKFDIGTGKTCQCVTSNRTQCTRPADKLIQVNDLMLWTCKQHRAKYPNATQVF